MAAPPPRDSLAEVAPSGAFARTPSTFLDAPALPLEPGRYALYISLACPWACRVLAVLALRGLRDRVAVVACAPTWEATAPAEDAHRGWVFRARARAGGVDAGLADVPLVDPFFGQETVRGVYALLCSEAGVPPPAKFTVPLLVDLRARRIVCNESSVLVRALGSGAAAGAPAGAPDLCPPELLAQVEAHNEAMYSAFNNGVYRCGFSTTQAAYDAAAADVAAYLDATAALLADGRAFLCGPALTESDVRLYVTLVRFDPVYVRHCWALPLFFPCRAGAAPGRPARALTRPPRFDFSPPALAGHTLQVRLSHSARQPAAAALPQEGARCAALRRAARGAPPRH